MLSLHEFPTNRIVCRTNFELTSKMQSETNLKSTIRRALGITIIFVI